MSVDSPICILRLSSKNFWPELRIHHWGLRNSAQERRNLSPGPRTHNLLLRGDILVTA